MIVAPFPKRAPRPTWRERFADRSKPRYVKIVYREGHIMGVDDK